MKLFLTIILSLSLILPAFSESKPIPGSPYYEDSKGISEYMQPNLLKTMKRGSTISCCGEADAYWADEFITDGDQYIAIITDPRDDNQFLNSQGSPRIHVNIGTKILIPNERLITFPEQPPNKTGHGWVWLHINQDDVTGQITNIMVLCYLAPNGG